jgi:xylulose-5-phosphate/fructose-6-phosphate phosphoketolase
LVGWVKVAVDRVAKPGSVAAYAKQIIQNKLVEHKRYIPIYGQDMPEVRQWEWALDHKQVIL